MLKTLTVLIAFVTASEAYAADCKAILDAAARLACFDRAAPTPKPHDSGATAPSSENFDAAKAVIGQKLKDPMCAVE